ncbi:hypothetical protein [Rhodovulum euryhalinum]|uniref:Uncharacterized protein n=1 Tax=Rhodovulum euryhalinum TaxID=35805 RepID=A0A4R2KEH8_9RHOB|nr:hypothetical protein [Rhodovulum euryhalinum]TCO72031.1 hypothetical protein EV655_105137 [Rhodovulum euryhalinum]
MGSEEVTRSVVEFAAQTGRLDLVSLLLAIVSTILVLGGVFAFLNFRSIAKAHAIVQAKETAEATAERVTNEYLQRELPDLLKAYRSFLDSDDVSNEAADQMAGAQDNGGKVE